MRFAKKVGYRRVQRLNILYSPAKSFESSMPILATRENPSTKSKKANGLSTVVPCNVFTATANK